MQWILHSLNLSTMTQTVSLTPRDTLLGGNFHQTFCLWMLCWYLFGDPGLLSALVRASAFGAVGTVVAAIMEGSRHRVTQRNSVNWTANIVASVEPFTLFGYIPVPEVTLPFWIPTAWSHSISSDALQVYERVRSYLSVQDTQG